MAFLVLQLVGRPPFNAPNHFMLVRQIQTQEVRLPDRLLGVLSASCVSLITGLLKKNPVERISFEEFFNHPFLNAAGATPSTTSAKPAASTDSMSSCQSVQTGIADRPPLPSRTSTDTSSGRGHGARSQTPPEERLPFAVDDWVGGGRTVTMEEPQYGVSAPSSTRIRATLVTPPSTRFAQLYGTPGQTPRLGAPVVFRRPCECALWFEVISARQNVNFGETLHLWEGEVAKSSVSFVGFLISACLPVRKSRFC
jgi:serine/threonine protein kinase